MENKKRTIGLLVSLILIVFAVLGVLYKIYQSRTIIPGMNYKKGECILAFENKSQKVYFKIVDSSKNDKNPGYVLKIATFDLANNLLRQSETTASEKTLSGLENKIVPCPKIME